MLVCLIYILKGDPVKQKSKVVCFGKVVFILFTEHQLLKLVIAGVTILRLQ